MRAMKLNSAGQSPTLLVFKTVLESCPFTRLLSSLVLIIHTPHGFGRGNVDGVRPDYLVCDYLSSYPYRNSPLEKVQPTMGTFRVQRPAPKELRLLWKLCSGIDWLILRLRSHILSTVQENQSAVSPWRRWMDHHQYARRGAHRQFPHVFVSGSHDYAQGLQSLGLA